MCTLQDYGFGACFEACALPVRSSYCVADAAGVGQYIMLTLAMCIANNTLKYHNAVTHANC